MIEDYITYFLGPSIAHALGSFCMVIFILALVFAYAYLIIKTFPNIFKGF